MATLEHGPRDPRGGLLIWPEGRKKGVKVGVARKSRGAAVPLSPEAERQVEH